MAAPAKRKTRAKAKTQARPARRRRAAVKQHGTETGYGQGCRCDECTAASTAGRVARRARKDRELSLKALGEELKALQETETVPGKRVAVPPELAEEYQQLRAAHDATGRDLLKAELAIKRLAGDAEVLTVKGREWGTWERVTRRFFDRDRFIEDHPAMFEKYQHERSTRRFIVRQYAATPPQRRTRAFIRRQRR